MWERNSSSKPYDKGWERRGRDRGKAQQQVKHWYEAGDNWWSKAPDGSDSDISRKQRDSLQLKKAH